MKVYNIYFKNDNFGLKQAVVVSTDIKNALVVLNQKIMASTNIPVNITESDVEIEVLENLLELYSYVYDAC